MLSFLHDECYHAMLTFCFYFTAQMCWGISDCLPGYYCGIDIVIKPFLRRCMKQTVKHITLTITPMQQCCDVWQYSGAKV